MSKDNRMINPATLANITKNSEVVENNTTNERTDETVIIRKKAKKITKALSISLPLENYNEYIQYLNNNNIDSGSELIRSLLREKGIIS